MASAHVTIVAQHYNQIEEKGLSERRKSRIVYLRNFNNWIKSMLIADAVQRLNADKLGENKYVLDIGAGKGGDLMKWKKNDIDYLVCADIAETSVQQCSQRYKDMMNRHKLQREKGHCYEAEFIAADCTKERLKDKFTKKDIEFEIVSCQFAFHYCFETFTQVKRMISNISESLKPGGYFIGSIPDANDIMRRLQESSDCTFGNDVFSVHFASKDKSKIPLFGAKYDFQLEGVVNCPEFLVHFPTFVKLADKYGDLELIYCHRFEDYYDKFSETEEGKTLLIRMDAFEAYPPVGFDHSRLMGGLDEYHYAQKKYDALSQKNESGENINLGTLTKSEWEIACMYLVFAFKKRTCSQND